METELAQNEFLFIYFFPDCFFTYPAIPIRPIPKRKITAGSGIEVCGFDCMGIVIRVIVIPINKKNAASSVIGFFFIIITPAILLFCILYCFCLHFPCRQAKEPGSFL